jgi:hypothetical protein
MTALTPALEIVARFQWPVLPIRPNGKAPLTRHGVTDASTDPALIRRWFMRWPEANLAIATGAPGPQVLDIDNLEAAAGVLARLARIECPVAATARGRHLYFHGTPAGTVALPFGELRGRGSYVVCPPSTHPSGKAYVWLDAPRGPLPAVPALIPAPTATAGAGEHQAPTTLVPLGQRHPYLRDFAVRLARAGILEERRLLAHLRLEFELACEPLPPPAPGALEAIAGWAAESRIAARERRGI